jgi:hypothetical protein
VNSTKLKRRDFLLDVLLLENADNDIYDIQLSPFAEEAQGSENWAIDPVTKTPIPKSVREYPITDYWEVPEHGE